MHICAVLSCLIPDDLSILLDTPPFHRDIAATNKQYVLKPRLKMKMTFDLDLVIKFIKTYCKLQTKNSMEPSHKVLMLILLSTNIRSADNYKALIELGSAITLRLFMPAKYYVHKQQQTQIFEIRQLSDPGLCPSDTSAHTGVTPHPTAFHGLNTCSSAPLSPTQLSLTPLLHGPCAS